MIYFIQAQESKRVKIGLTRGDVQNRLRALQSGSPEILKLIGIITDGFEALEQELHAKFDEYRLHFEWFSFCSDIEAYVSENCEPNPATLPRVKPNALTEYLKGKGATTRLADALGVTKGAITQWNGTVPLLRVQAVSEVIGCDPVNLRPDFFGVAA